MSALPLPQLHFWHNYWHLHLSYKTNGHDITLTAIVHGNYDDNTEDRYTLKWVLCHEAGTEVELMEPREYDEALAAVELHEGHDAAKAWIDKMNHMTWHMAGNIYGYAFKEARRSIEQRWAALQLIVQPQLPL